jgi:hypothetical protein
MSDELRDLLNAVENDDLLVYPDGTIFDRESDTSHDIADIEQHLAELHGTLTSLARIIEWAKAAPFRDAE